MSGVLCFTSINYHYLAKARVLASSLKRFHPDWHFVLCVTDAMPDGGTLDLAGEPFDELLITQEVLGDLGPGWFFKHDVVEVCTAVKGPLLEKFCDRGFDAIVYLDPDIAVFNPLQGLIEALERSDILLTPHQLEPDDQYYQIFDNEVCSLRHGIFNLGFVAIKPSAEGRRFARWWSARLTDFCVSDERLGLFVDQKWCDHVPVFFDGVKILRDPGYNVASWNLSRRKISIDRSGRILCNGKLLYFYHFTKLGPVGDAMTQRYAKDNIEVYELWSWYRRKVEDFAFDDLPDGWWALGQFSNGAKITSEQRRCYRDRPDLQTYFPDPYLAEGNSFYEWCGRNA